MLDEKKEFEQYTFSLGESEQKPRLKYGKIAENLSGITRAMTVIARKAIFERVSSGEISKDILALVEKELRVWCGDTSEEPKETSEGNTEGWLRKYFVKFFSKDLQNKALEALDKKYGEWGFEKKLFAKGFEDTEQNSFKKLSYEKALADAIVAGPLARYYLVCEKENLEQLEYKTKKGKKRVLPAKGDWLDKTKNNVDLIRKTVATYLLAKKAREEEIQKLVDAGLPMQLVGCGEEQYTVLVPINKTDLGNWLTISRTTKIEIEKFLYEARPLFRTARGENNVSIAVDAAWMRKCGWRVLPEEELEAYLTEHPEAKYFRDLGGGEYLEEVDCTKNT